MSLFRLSDTQRHGFGQACAVILALTVPLLLVGRAALSATLVLALITGALAADWAAVRGVLAEACRNRLVQLGGLVLLLWSLSIPGSLDLESSASNWVGVIGLVWVMGFFWSLIATNSVPLRLLLKVQVGSMAVVAGILAAVYLGMWEILGLVKFKGWVAIDPLSIAKPLANGYMLLLPVLLYASWCLRGFWRVLVAIETVGILILADLAGARSALAGAAGASGIAALMLGVALRGWKGRLAVLAMTGMILGGLVAVAMSSASRDGSNSDLAYLPTSILDFHRQMIWKFTWEKAWERPVVGYGMNAVNLVPGAKEHAPGLDFELIPSHPHNWALEVFAETGVVGVLPLLVLVVGTGIWLLLQYGHRRRAALMAAGGVYGVYWASGLFNFSFWAPWWMATHMLCFCVIMAAVTQECQQEPKGDD